MSGCHLSLVNALAFRCSGFMGKRARTKEPSGEIALATRRTKINDWTTFCKEMDCLQKFHLLAPLILHPVIGLRALTSSGTN
ncbi:hypothetical protein CEXT_576021 [Caerostris extrusa]|uniref:Secreted protein n=1 Tax=Caerostris extrusa TaxID=172846 RepID=A0AAV4SJ69_CAEEX|nr:hypothetical protein CEXT_576021 [Caerostris extrusa]